MLTPIPAQEAPTQYISLKEAVGLGYGAYSTLRTWIANGRLPAVKIGNRVKVTLADLEALANPKCVSEEAERRLADSAAIARIVDAAPRLTVEQRQQNALIVGSTPKTQGVEA